MKSFKSIYENEKLKTTNGTKKIQSKPIELLNHIDTKSLKNFTGVGYERNTK